MERFKADFSFMADVLAVLLALAGLILWARKGEHWRALTVGIGAFGWIYLATYGPYMVLTHNETGDMAGLPGFIGILLVVGSLVVTLPLALILGTTTPLVVAGLLLALVSALIAGLHLWARYTE